MKKILFMLILFFCCVIRISAEEQKSITVSFDESAFSYVYDADSVLAIIDNKHNSVYDMDIQKPGLPMVPVNVRIPNDCTFAGVRGEAFKSLLYENVLIAHNPVCVSTNGRGNETVQVSSTSYKETVYPISNVEYITTSTMDGYTILRFLVCPFVYDVQAKKLYFVEKEKLDISINFSTSVTSHSISPFIGNNMKEIVNDLVVNAEEFSGEDVAVHLGNIAVTPAPIPLSYVIVTSEDLAESFKPLAQWKMMKGLKSRIITMEDVVKKYPKQSKQNALKTYLYDLYNTEGLTYVLLGGDDEVVPVQNCYISVNKGTSQNPESKPEQIPADLFYACFDKDLYWNSNGNQLIGEFNDNVSFDPSIFVTRAPVRTCKGVDAFVSKIIEYEQYPLINGWSNNILTAGYKAFGTNEKGQSDAETNGNILYERGIQPYWNGTRKSFYDTFSDVSESILNGQNLQNQLESGYLFADIYGHGTSKSWVLENNNNYTTQDAKKLHNKQKTIVTTISCHTNAFDGENNEPCLSESFIRNPDSGIIAYLGSSREGWTWENNKFSGGPSLDYLIKYYKNILSNETPMSFGAAVAKAKMTYVNSSMYYNYYRWLQLALNPVGDPEMPVVTTEPQTFSMASIQFGFNGKVYVNTGVENCKICFMSIDDNGESQYERIFNTRSATFSPKVDNYSICITKLGYQPYVFKNIMEAENKNRIKECMVSSLSTSVTVSTSIEEKAKNANIKVHSMQGNTVGTYKIGNGSTRITIPTKEKGVHTVSLVVDGKVTDSRSVLIK